ncbi:reverse transcriptase [Elysia marginata]|uniref:Reverse transcriptase n=1 Tax=Elysia marginata TaxID=1093978 RepID=A0AAV4J9U3_9GAST|nr:reverse transcriptase [Elysia marginata]
MGHFAKECRSRLHVAAAHADVIMCSYCNRRGHQVNECWKKQTEERSPKGTHAVAGVQQVGETCGHHQLKCGCKLPVLSAACGEQKTMKMPLALGSLDGKPVSVLRDSGCSCVVVRKGLGKGSGKGGKTLVVTLADGSNLAAESTQAFLDCPYFRGKVEAVEMESPLYDVILGNIVGAKCPGTVVEDSLNLNKAEGKEALAAQTRAASQRKDLKPLITPSSPD